MGARKGLRQPVQVMQASLEPIVAKAPRVMYLQQNIDNFWPLGQRRAISAATPVVGLTTSMFHAYIRAFTAQWTLQCSSTSWPSRRSIAVPKICPGEALRMTLRPVDRFIRLNGRSQRKADCLLFDAK
jgi:hypothetical protein